MKPVVALISGGIDSPVAAYTVGRLGYRIIPVHFVNAPFSSEGDKEKVLKIVEKLREHVEIDDVVFVPHGHNLLEFSKKCERRFACVLCKRMMFRIAERLSQKLGAEAIVTGEFLGSKASQTLRNLEVISQTVNIPVIRPLLGMDKEEIQIIGRKIGTFNRGIGQAGCCSITPYKPSTKASLEKILEEEGKVDVEGLVEKSIFSVV